MCKIEINACTRMSEYIFYSCFLVDGIEQMNWNLLCIWTCMDWFKWLLKAQVFIHGQTSSTLSPKKKSLHRNIRNKNSVKRIISLISVCLSQSLMLPYKVKAIWPKTFKLNTMLRLVNWRHFICYNHTLSPLICHNIALWMF